MIDALWAVVAELANSGGSSANKVGQQGTRQRGKTLRGGEPFTQTSRVEHSLLWINAFLARLVGSGELGRTVDSRCWGAGPCIPLTCDASPWGLGAILEVDDVIVAYLFDEISEFDVLLLGVQIGSCRSQAILEALALCVAIRTWSSDRTQVCIRSDSQAALGAIGKLASPCPAINRIAREIALDIALSRYGIDIQAHIKGKDNVLADKLSRMGEPEASAGPARLPSQLSQVLRTEVAVRNEGWWESARAPKLSSR